MKELNITDCHLILKALDLFSKEKGNTFSEKGLRCFEELYDKIYDGKMELLDNENMNQSLSLEEKQNELEQYIMNNGWCKPEELPKRFQNKSYLRIYDQMLEDGEF